ncbi:MAG: MFS transporter [Clostridia bacterium]|nr:MFS transporter [Clostridia bacterium]
MIEKIKGFINEIIAYWRVPAAGDSVAYKEYLMLSVGWLGMRLATVFGIAFAVNNPFTAMTLHMTHRDLLIFGYICTAIGYAIAPLNAYIIDNLRSRDGKYRVFVKLAVPSGILSLFALFFPYEKLGYIPMVISLFLIGQIQGYVQGWYSTGVSNLVYVISPNSQERVKIMTVSSLIHNFAPTLTGFLIPVLSDVLADGDLYNIKTYRMIYPAVIVIGVIMSMAAYYGVSERIVVPKSRVTKVGLIDALKAVSKNKLFWIKCSDNWNNFMEDSKNVLMQWLFYYGKVGSMTTYGIMDTLSYNSSMWAMIFSPWLIDKLGKKGFKLTKNILQVFITLGLALTYKKSLALIFVFYFLNRFWETTEVVDRAMESDIRDYQQYISGERIDGSFGVVDTYVGGAVGAVTNLFVPWVYKRNGFDGTDYTVLNVYNENGTYNSGNVLYTLLDKLLMISLVGAVIDILPWFLYDLTETDQKAVVRVVRLRSAVEDKKAGLLEDDVYCEACEALQSMKEYIDKEKLNKIKEDSSLDKKERKAKNKEIRNHNEEIEIAEFLGRELNRYGTSFGTEFIKLCRLMAGSEAGNLETDFEKIAVALPQGECKEERTLRSDAIGMARAVKRSAKVIDTHPESAVEEISADDYENLFDLPEDTKEQRAEKRLLIKDANRRRNRYGKVMKPYIWAQRHVTLCEAYENIDLFTADYDESRKRLDEKHLAEKKAADEAAAKRKLEAQARRAEKQAK